MFYDKESNNFPTPLYFLPNFTFQRSKSGVCSLITHAKIGCSFSRSAEPKKNIKKLGKTFLKIEIKPEFKSELRRLERVFSCTRARNLHTP